MAALPPQARDGAGASPAQARFERWLEELRQDPASAGALQRRIEQLMRDPVVARRVAEGLAARARAAQEQEQEGRPGGLGRWLRGFVSDSDGGMALPRGPAILHLPPGEAARAAARRHRARLALGVFVAASEPLLALAPG